MNKIEWQKRNEAENIVKEMIAILEPKKEKSSVAFRLYNQLISMKLSIYKMPLKNVETIIANKEKNMNIAKETSK